MDEQQKQTILDLPKVIAVGIASPIATILTSRFGIAGTLIGLALSAVILTVLADVLKVYLSRVPGAVTTIPGGFRKRSSLRNLLDRIRRPFSKFWSLAPARRRSILIGSIAVAGISFFVGLSVVTALEVGVGKSLSCWVWDDCYAGSSTDYGGTVSVTGTLPSILGGGQSVSSGASKVQPPSPQQPTPGAPGSPSQPKGVPGSERPSSPQPGQWRSPSGVPEGGKPQPNSSEASGEGEQQPSSSEVSQEDEQQSPVDGSEGGDQRPSLSGRSEEDEQRSPAGGPEEDEWWSAADEAEQDERRNPVDGSKRDQQQEDQSNQPSSGSDRETREPPAPSAP